MRKIIVAIFLSIVLSACMEIKYDNGLESSFHVCCEDASDTRSSLSESAFQVYDIRVLVYDGDKLVTDAFSSSGGDVTVFFPDAAKKYDVFVLANVGNVSAPSNESELKALLLDVSSLSEMSDNGIPMAGSIQAYLPSSSTRIKVKMLYSRIQLFFDSSAQKADYTLKSVRLRNSAGSVCPFGEDNAATMTVSYGDSLSHEDLSSLQEGDDVFLYAPENKQGVLLPFNDDPFQKIPSSLTSPEQASKCTYLEVLADVVTPAASFKDVCFRTYLGADITSDFNLIRSVRYKYGIDFESNMIREEKWRIDPSEPVALGQFELSKKTAMVIKGITDTVFVSPGSLNGKELEFAVDIDGSDAGLSCAVKDVYRGGKAVKALVFSTSCPIDGLNDYKNEPDVKLCKVTVRSKESWGGSPLISESIDVKVFHEVFPIFLKTVPVGTSCRMYAYSNNPLGIPFSGSVLVRSGQELTGITRNFSSAVPNRGGALLAQIPCYEGGMAIFLEMKPQIAGYAREMYMGNNSKKYFGPGTDHAPGNCATYSSDGEYSMEYSMAIDAQSRNYLARLSSSSGYLFRLDPNTTGWNCYNSYNLQSFEGKPFYFINGGLQIYVVGKVEDAAKYLDDSGRVGFTVFAFEPGRDLCLDSKYGSKGYCSFGAQLGVMTQLFGNVHRWLAWREYEYGVYLSINGCSCWAGATKGSSGYVIN